LGSPSRSPSGSLRRRALSARISTDYRKRQTLCSGCPEKDPLCNACISSHAAGDGSLVTKRWTPWVKRMIQALTSMRASKSGMLSMRGRSRPGGYTACASSASVSVGRMENTRRGRHPSSSANGRSAVSASRDTRMEFIKPVTRKTGNFDAREFTGLNWLKKGKFREGQKTDPAKSGLHCPVLLSNRHLACG